jgi:hypothetical protein
VDESEDTVTAIDEPVPVALLNSAAKLCFDGIGAAGGLLDVERDDGTVPWQAPGRGLSRQVCRRVRPLRSHARLPRAAGRREITARNGTALLMAEPGRPGRC